MRFEVQGSEEEIARLRAELAKRHPTQGFDFGAPTALPARFGSRAPLGEAVTVSVVVTVVVTTLTTEIVKDVYKLIKEKYTAMKVVPVDGGGDD